MGTVISIRDWKSARIRSAHADALIAAIQKYCKGQGPFDALAMAMAARRFTDRTWRIVEAMAGLVGSSEVTRQIVLDELEDRAREVRLKREGSK